MHAGRGRPSQPIFCANFLFRDPTLVIYIYLTLCLHTLLLPLFYIPDVLFVYLSTSTYRETHPSMASRIGNFEKHRFFDQETVFLSRETLLIAQYTEEFVVL